MPFQIGFNRRFDPGHAAGRRRRRRRAAPRPHHQPRPRAAAARLRAVSGGIFLDMTIHDFDMARFVAKSEVVEVFARGVGARSTPAFAEAGDVDTAVVAARARERLLDDDRQLAPGRLRLRPARRGVRLGGHGRVGEPARARGDRPHRRGHARGDVAVLLPRALHPDLPARVGGVRERGRVRARRRSSGRPTPARRWSSAWPPGSRCARGRPCSLSLSARRQGRRRHRRHAGPGRGDRPPRRRPGRAASPCAGATASAARPSRPSSNGFFVPVELTDAAPVPGASCPPSTRTSAASTGSSTRRVCPPAGRSTTRASRCGTSCSRSTCARRSC